MFCFLGDLLSMYFLNSMNNMLIFNYNIKLFFQNNSIKKYYFLLFSIHKDRLKTFNNSFLQICFVQYQSIQNIK